MNRMIQSAFVAIALLSSGNGYSAEATSSEHGAQADIAVHKSCQYCGMDREKFGHSRMLVEYEDGTTVALCSLHCAVIDLSKNNGKTVKAIQVADYGSKDLLDAKKATWVIGGGKSGVMTKTAKWAFRTPENAAAFTKENGGKVATFEEALKAAREGIPADAKMIREKRKMRQHKK